MKFMMHLSVTAEVEAESEAEALTKVNALTIADMTKTSTQIVPSQEHAH